MPGNYLGRRCRICLFLAITPCFQNLTPTEFMQSLLRACCLTARRYKAPLGFPNSAIYFTCDLSREPFIAFLFNTAVHLGCDCVCSTHVFAHFHGREAQGFFFVFFSRAVCDHRLELLQPSVIAVMAAFPAVVSQSDLTRPRA